MKSNRRRGRHVVSLVKRASLRTLLTEAELPLRRDRLIEYLHVIQDQVGHLPEGLLAALAAELTISLAEVAEVASFYHHFDVVRAGEASPPALTVRVCSSLSCAMHGGEALADRLAATLGQSVRVQRVSCVGRCDSAPVAVVGRHPVDRASESAVREAVAQGRIEAPLPAAEGLAAYRARGGYAMYESCLAGARTREAVIDALDQSGLRGLGGAGFPVGRKWRLVSAQPAPRHLAINIDEGEPGTFKDRHYLESEPHAFLEGALIAAWAVGIDGIWIYLRDEYAGARAMLERELALLRVRYPGAPPLELRRGAGAYICGEESAMIESLEGKRGMPRLRPPYLAEVGLFGRPTLEHNMESLHWVQTILRDGAERFATQGRRGRKGLRSFSVSGRVARPGMYVAPAGITLNELLAEHCGGMAPGHVLYGYFPGGASGGILPASRADLPLDFDTLQDEGCFIGSAALVVFSQHDKARLLALNAMAFFTHESCGQCTPCRVGTRQAVAMMRAERWDRATLEELSRLMQDTSICGLGQAAPNPVLSVLRHFPREVGQ